MYCQMQAKWETCCREANHVILSNDNNLRFACYYHAPKAEGESGAKLYKLLRLDFKKSPCPNKHEYWRQAVYSPELARAWCQKCGKEIDYFAIQAEIDAAQAKRIGREKSREKRDRLALGAKQQAKMF